MNNDMVERDNSSPERVSERPAVAPRVDLYENEDEIQLLADLPGVTQDGMEIQFHDGILSIVGRRELGREGAVVVSSEYRPTDYARHFTIPNGIDVEKIDAALRDGLLRVRLPKLAALKPHRVEIAAD